MMIKKIFLHLLCVALLLSCSGCKSQTQSPSSTVEETLKQAQLNYGSPILDIEEELVNFYSSELNMAVGEVVGRFNYTIVSESIDANQAEVTVEIEAFAIGDAFVKAAYEGMSAASFNEDETKTTTDYIIAYWQQYLDEAVMNDERVNNTIIIQLNKTANGWEIVEENHDLINALLGNLYSMS